MQITKGCTTPPLSEGKRQLSGDEVPKLPCRFCTLVTFERLTQDRCQGRSLEVPLVACAIPPLARAGLLRRASEKMA